MKPTGEHRSMRVLMVSSEMAPFAKVGGLADVVEALPPALQDRGIDVRVAIPLYARIDRDALEVRPDPEVPRLAVRVGPEDLEARYYRAVEPTGKVTVHFVGSERFFDREGIYNDPVTGEGYSDNAERFLFFGRAVQELVRALGWRPDVVHGHDHQAAPTIADLRGPLARDPLFAGVGSVFTIHNLGYQGIFPPSILPFMGLGPERFYPMSPFEFFGNVNFMKAGIHFADMVTTVSERYAQEITESDEYGAGLEGVLRARGADLVGILNGVDYSQWDPSVDKLIPHRYAPADLSGKGLDRSELRRHFGLPSPGRRVPLIGMVSRLADQKGFDLLEQAMPELAAMDVQLAVLGTGQERYHDMLTRAAARHPDKIAVRLEFNNATAHLVEAGSDLFLMPSRYEPCGLNQMYSLRYGTVPVVRSTGGLADTVLDDDARQGQGTGFSFHAYESAEMVDAIRRALNAFADETRWTTLMLRCMRRDHSWKASARRYVEVYERAAEQGNRRREAAAQEV